MTTAELLEKVRDVLATDENLLRYCRDDIGVMPTIQIDFDEEQELDVDCYPFIGVLSVTHDGNIKQRRDTFTLRLMVATRKGDLTATTADVDLDGATVTVKKRAYPGRLQAETLREKAIEALYRGQIGKVTVGSDDMSHTYHPKFYSPFTVTIETLR